MAFFQDIGGVSGQYIRPSQPAAPDTTVGEALQGATELAKLGIGYYEKQKAAGVEQGLYEALAAEEATFEVAQQPEAIKAGVGEVKNIQSGYKQGRLSLSERDARLDQVVRKYARSYPEYAKQIRESANTYIGRDVGAIAANAEIEQEKMALQQRFAQQQSVYNLALETGQLRYTEGGDIDWEATSLGTQKQAFAIQQMKIQAQQYGLQNQRLDMQFKLQRNQQQKELGGLTPEQFRKQAQTQVLNGVSELSRGIVEGEWSRVVAEASRAATETERVTMLQKGLAGLRVRLNKQSSEFLKQNPELGGLVGPSDLQGVIDDQMKSVDNYLAAIEKAATSERRIPDAYLSAQGFNQFMQLPKNVQTTLSTLNLTPDIASNILLDSSGAKLVSDVVSSLENSLPIRTDGTGEENAKAVKYNTEIYKNIAQQFDANPRSVSPENKTMMQNALMNNWKLLADGTTSTDLYGATSSPLTQLNQVDIFRQTTPKDGQRIKMLLDTEGSDPKVQALAQKYVSGLQNTINSASALIHRESGNAAPEFFSVNEQGEYKLDRKAIAEFNRNMRGAEVAVGPMGATVRPTAAAGRLASSQSISKDLEKYVQTLTSAISQMELYGTPIKQTLEGTSNEN